MQKNQLARRSKNHFAQPREHRLHAAGGRRNQPCHRLLVDVSFLQPVHDRLCDGKDVLFGRTGARDREGRPHDPERGADVGGARLRQHDGQKDGQSRPVRH